MPRARLLYPEFAKHEGLGELSHTHRLLFAMLPMLADREGRLEDRPRRIKADLFPYDDVTAEQVDGMLQELADAGFLVRYEGSPKVSPPGNGTTGAGGAEAYPRPAPGQPTRCVSIPGFARWQKPHPREKASELPPPPQSTESKANPGQALGTPRRPVSVSDPESDPVSGFQAGMPPASRALNLDTTRNSKSATQPAEPWPADLVEQLRVPLQRQLETNDAAWAEFLHTTAAKYPLQRRVNAGMVLLQRAETGEKFGLGYLLTLIRDGVEPRKPRQTPYANGNGVPVERMTVPASESKVLPPYVPPPESRDEMNKRLLDRAEAEIAKRKGRVP